MSYLDSGKLNVSSKNTMKSPVSVSAVRPSLNHWAMLRSGTVSISIDSCPISRQPSTAAIPFIDQRYQSTDNYSYYEFDLWNKLI